MSSTGPLSASWLYDGGMCALFAQSSASSALDPAGIQATHISRLWWLYFWVNLTVYCLVLAVILLAVLRRRNAGSDEPLTQPPEPAERRLTWAVGGAVFVTAVLLFVLLIGDYVTGRTLHSLNDPDARRIRITAHQWWWEVQYDAEQPSDIVTTANELHLPIGETVQIDMQSPDVIHSFWVPNLHGKRDIIPGHPTRIVLRADREGTYWGRCAEYCGHQHANMLFVVVVEPPDQFQRWLEAQRQPAPEPATESERHGQQVFLNTTCIMCHTVRGTPARGRMGPDLTHVASRPRIAAGKLPNTRGHLGGWIVDPQTEKPGVRMPLNALSPEDLQTLLDYLDSLK